MQIFAELVVQTC